VCPDLSSEGLDFVTASHPLLLSTLVIAISKHGRCVAPDLVPFWGSRGQLVHQAECVTSCARCAREWHKLSE
jgi:hypothetical protein